jgi:hypothetical protein
MDNVLKKIIGLLIIVLTIGNFIRCNDETEDVRFASGIYMGHFDYQGTHYWCEIDFDSTRYVEVPSGGAFYQKSDLCLTVGGYTTHENKIVFTLDSFKFPGSSETCVSDMLLPGEYTIYNTNKADSIIFERGKDSHEIKYYLKKLILDE